MDIRVAEEQAFLLRETMTWDQAREKAWDRKTAVFGTISRLFVKGEDIEIPYSERRYEPFWHLVCSAHYVYDRHQQVDDPCLWPRSQTHHHPRRGL